MLQRAVVLLLEGKREDACTVLTSWTAAFSARRRRRCGPDLETVDPHRPVDDERDAAWLMTDPLPAEGGLAELAAHFDLRGTNIDSLSAVGVVDTFLSLEIVRTIFSFKNIVPCSALQRVAVIVASQQVREGRSDDIFHEYQCVDTIAFV